MKFNSNTHFEITSSEVKDFALALAKGFIKVQQWKAELDKSSSSSSSSISESIRRKDRINLSHEQRMEELNRRHKERMAEIDRRHKERMAEHEHRMAEINKKIAYVESKCKKSDDIDVSTLPEEIKRQIALDYLRKHPLSEDKQEAVAKEYIRKYGVIK